MDVESDGPVPGLNSMLSLGAVAIGWNNNKAEWQVTQSFNANLKSLPEPAAPDGRTMQEFWLKNPKAWTEATENAMDPAYIMSQFVDWCRDVQAFWGRRPIALCGPAGFDFAYVRYYLQRFTGDDFPFRHSCIDLKTVASMKLNLPYKDSGKSSYPKHWSRDMFPHTHKAVDDALEQGWLYARMLDS